jgi:hypothetical protein
VQQTTINLNRHDPVRGIFVVFRVGCKMVCVPRSGVTDLCPRTPVGVAMREELFPPLAVPFTPTDRIAATQSIDDVPGQNLRNFVRIAVGEDCYSQAKARHERHQWAPADPTTATHNQAVTPIVAV